ncbi:MAG TPA: GGDEF domain-containing protein [Candidatus Dormibacteraeota bacterium]|nr:GGDEF domain-containing protein [Candidatus Dormibacteraeota bacterium]
MPLSDIILAAIGILATVAVALLLAPMFVWARRRFFTRDDPAQETKPEGMLDPKLITNEMIVRTAPPADDGAAATAAAAAAGPVTSDPSLEERVVRIVSWAFLMAVAVFAAASGLWNLSLPQIVILVAVTGESLLILQDVLPRTPLRKARGPLQGVLAIAFAAGLVALTGGLDSPFTFTFPLIVGAGALLVAPRIALILATVATAVYLATGLAVTPNPAPGPLVQMLVNLTGLYLLAYIGASVGREQRRARDAAIRLSTVDSLTGLYNRTFFFSALEREIARGDRSGRAFCLVMLDLDDLKTINDRFGHIAGDQVLRAVSDVVRNGVRKIDVAARYGGDEFVALLPETDPTGGWVLAEKIRLTVADQGAPGVDPSPTVSVGVVSYPIDGRSADALLVSADRAMYASKRGGKNRVARAAAEPMVVAIDSHEGGRAREGGRAG